MGFRIPVIRLSAVTRCAILKVPRQRSELLADSFGFFCSVLYFSTASHTVARAGLDILCKPGWQEMCGDLPASASRLASNVWSAGAHHLWKPWDTRFVMHVNEAGAGKKYHNTCEWLIFSPPKDKLYAAHSHPAKRSVPRTLSPRRGGSLAAQDGRGGNISEKWQGGHLSQNMDQRVMKVLEESIYSTGNP